MKIDCDVPGTLGALAALCFMAGCVYQMGYAWLTSRRGDRADQRRRSAMTKSQEKVLAVYPHARCWRSVAEHVRGDGFRVRTATGVVIGYGATEGKAWRDAADRL